MKIIKHDKLVTLQITKTETELQVQINGINLLMEDGILKEKEVTITVSQAQSIQNKYTPQSNGQFSKEDFLAIQEEVDEYTINKEVIFYIGDINVLKEVQKALAFNN